MSSDDKDGKLHELRPVVEAKANNILPLNSRMPVDDEESRERIRGMAEIRSLTKPELAELRIIFPGMTDQKMLNAFRDLRTQLYQLAQGRDNFVLLVTSIGHGGGSSFVTTNLGAAIALDESKTAIIVDCNVYDPTLQRIFPFDPEHGLVEYMENSRLDVKDIVYSTGVKRLRLIPAGRKLEPGAELFTSSRMRRFIDEIRSRYRDRYVIIDAPPIGTSADARILAELCDFVLLVVPFGGATAAQVQAAVDAVGEKKMAGVVFNN